MTRKEKKRMRMTEERNKRQKKGGLLSMEGNLTFLNLINTGLNHPI